MCRLRNYRRHHFHRDLQTQVTRTGPQMKLRKYLQNYSFLILCIEKLHFYLWFIMCLRIFVREVMQMKYRERIQWIVLSLLAEMLYEFCGLSVNT